MTTPAPQPDSITKDGTVLRTSVGDDGHTRYHCPACDYTHLTPSGAMLHHTQVHGEPLPCEECGKLLPTPSSLAHHMRAHRPEEFSCPLCGKVFRSRSGLNKHEKTHENQNEQLVLLRDRLENADVTEVSTDELVTRVVEAMPYIRELARRTGEVQGQLTAIQQSLRGLL